jgi:hypothetical protein
MPKVHYLLALLVTTFLLTGFISVPEETSAEDQAITYAETAEAVVIETGEMEIAISKAFPAAMILPAGQDEEPGYGVVISSVFGYNATEDGMLVLEEVPYRASFEHATWSLSGVTHETDSEKGETVSVEMTASLNMNRRIAAFGDDQPKEPGEPGIEIIEDWGQATVRFCVTSNNYSALYVDVQDSPEYDVNGTTELKFDVSIDINEAIYAQDMALDIGLMKMENYTFTPTSMPEQYVFRGYQNDTISESDPYENETDGDVQIVHKFNPRSGFKQLFTFVEGDQEESYFGWARQAELAWTGEEDELVDIATLYRTDGESLRVYLSTPLNNTTTSIFHDPSIGLFPGSGGYVDIPDDIIPVGSSGESVMLGAAIGIMLVGVVGAYVVVKKSSDEDPSDIVSLEKNRYYRKRP